MTKNLSEAVDNADLIFISSDHKMYSKLNKKSLKSSKKRTLIFDGRNILKRNNFEKNSVMTIGY